MNKLAELRRDRTEKRRRVAEEAARRVLEGAQAQGLEVTLIGSLANGRFALHSDVDFFVHGQTDAERRVLIERLVAGAFRHASVPYDIIYGSDLTKERAREFLES
jgi:predicted nucleotidyltransferase